MSQENVEAARRCIEAYRRGDYEEALEYLAPDVVWEVGQELPAHGPAEVREVWRRWDAEWEELETETDEIIDAGNQLIVVVSYRGRGRASGVEVNDRIFEVHTLRDGRCIRKIEFPARAEALAAVGLSDHLPKTPGGTDGGRRAVSQDTHEEDLEFVRKVWTAVRGDIRNALSFYCDDIEIVPFGATLEGRVYRGHAGVIDWWDNEIVTNWEAFETIAEDVQRVGDQLLVSGHWRARGRTSGVELEMPATWVVAVRDGKIARWQTFTDRGEALEAVGLSE